MGVLTSFRGGGSVVVSNAQTGNGDSTNIVDRGSFGGLDAAVSPAVIVVSTVGGATPSCTYQVQGSVDGVNFFNLPTTKPDDNSSAATFATTTTTVVHRLVLGTFPWRYLKVVMSANTNVTNTITVYTT